MSVSVVAKNIYSGVGEGPHWEEKTQTLMHVDIIARAVHRYNPATGVNEKRQVGE